jgi:acetyl esterase/lipase
MEDPSWSAERWGDADGPLVAVFVHGGFWRARYAADTIAPLAQACAADDLGAWTWNLEYPRVGMSGGGWPGTAVAVRDAIDAAVAQADGRPVAVIGHSAGGHLALWAARGRPVALAVSLAGVCDLEDALTLGLGNGAVLEFLGARPDSDLYAAASPIARLPLGVPALLIHGDADDDVPISQSRRYHAAAVASGDDCELRELPGGGHFEVVDPDGRAWPILRERLGELARRPAG